MVATTKALGLAVSVLVFAAQLTPVPAAPPGGVSEHFPNDGECGGPLCNVDSPCIGCGAAALELRLAVAGMGAPIATSVTLTALDTGAAVADNAATALCTAAIAAGWVCGGGCAFPSPLLSCTNGGKQIDFSQTSFSFSVVPGNAGTKIASLHTKTSAGNTHGPDLLSRVLLRVNPNGHDGNVLLKATGAPGPGPNPFTVNTTGLSDQALHDAIRQGFAAMGVTPVLHPASDSVLSIAPANFNGYFVEISYPASVTEFEVNGRPGQILIEEATDPSSLAVPALSAWGAAGLIAIILLFCNRMFLRGRRKEQSA
jgi:hypothetical protein